MSSGLRIIQGGSNGTGSMRLIAGEAIGSPRVIMVKTGNAYLFDPSDENNYGYIAGVSQNSAILGDYVTVITGEILTSTGSFVQDTEYWAGPSGTLITSPPVTGLSQYIGTGIDTDRLHVNILNPIITQ